MTSGQRGRIRVATWGYVFLMHFGHGALSGRGFGTLAVAVGAAGVALLLVPIYKNAVRACWDWDHGLENILDPVRWRDAVRNVMRELSDQEPQAASESSAQAPSQ